MPVQTDECAAEIMEAVPLVMRTIRAEMRRRRRDGLSVPAFRAMIYIDRQPMASLTEVADYLGLTTATVCVLVDDLVEKKFMLRGSSKVDRRKIVLTLTPEGQSILDTARHGTLNQVEKLLDSLTVPERTSILDAMQLLRQVFSRQEPGAPEK